MNRRSAVFIFCILSLLVPWGHLAAESIPPCSGHGTAVFFGNGMFNSRAEAEDSTEQLEILSSHQLKAESFRKLEYSLLYKPSEPFFRQLVNANRQKTKDSWESFWLMATGLSEAPKWFRDAETEVKRNLVDEKVEYYPELDSHLDYLYQTLMVGFNVILVSHSQGNFYANQLMKHLPDHSDHTYNGSLKRRRESNPHFPEFKDIFSNIQVATPVTKVHGDYHWVTLPDDQVINWVRKVFGALPANIKSNGSGPSPIGDPRGHGFVSAYLKNEESRGALLSHMEAAFNRMKYPIPFNDEFATFVERVDFNQEHSLMFVESPDSQLDQHFVTEVNYPGSLRDNIAGHLCRDLKPDVYKLYLTVYPTTKGQGWFDFYRSDRSRSTEKVRVGPVEFVGSDHRRDEYLVTSTTVERGSGKDAFKINIDLKNPPELIKRLGP